MRYAFLAFYLVSIIMAFHPGSAQADAPPLNGEMSKFNFSNSDAEFSQISLADLSDNQVTLGQFRGKIILLNVWATWCGPCIMEMPGLDKLQASLGGSDFQVVPVSIDRGGGHQAKPFLDRMGVRAMTPYFDKSNNIGRMLSASRIPLTVIIGRDGTEIGRFVGTADWGGPEAQALIKYFIAYGGDVAKMKYEKSVNQVAMTR